MHNLITAKQIAQLLGKSRQAIEKRAKKEGWKYEERPNPRGGKPIKFYYLETLPSDIKSALEQCNQFPLSNATFNGKWEPEKFSLNKANATESGNQSGNQNETLENKSSDNATSEKNKTESVNLTNATDENIDIKEFANATSMQPDKLDENSNATSTNETNATNATESGNQSGNCNVNLENKEFKNATNIKNTTESENKKCNLDKNTENKGSKNATNNATLKNKNATCEKNATENATKNATESGNQCNQIDGLPEWITASQLSHILGVSKRAINKRANEEKWEYRKVPTKGGYQKQFKTDSLPGDIFRKLILKLTNQYSDLPEEFVPRFSTKSLEELKECMRLYMIAPDQHKKEADAKLAIIKAYETFRQRSSDLKEGEAKSLFIKLFNQGKISVPEAYEVGIDQITLKTFYKWLEDYNLNGLYGLLPKHIQKGRKSKITPEMIKIIWAQIGKGITRGKKIYEALKYHKLKGDIKEDLPSYASFMRFYQKFKRENDAKIKMILEPDKFRSEYMPAFGDQTEQYKAEYYGQVLMLDATKGDVMCRWKEEVDGKLIEKTKRLTLTIFIDVYSRDIRFALSERENSYVVVDSLLRNWLLDVGVPELIITDNGSVYKSKHFQQVSNRFNIKILYTQAYSPEQKAIVERAFGTIATQFFETLEGYIGHNVEQRKAIESRKKWATKLYKDDSFSVEILLSPEQLQERIEEYLEKRYRKERHSFGIVEELIAKSPKLSPKITDERTLDILLGEEHRRKLTNKGIRLNNRIYVSDKLIDYYLEKGKESWVIVREDISDIRRIYVYDTKGQFICEAFDTRGLSEEIKASVAKKAHKKALRSAKEERKKIKQFTEEYSSTPYEIMLTGWQEPKKQNNQDTKVIQFPRPQQEFENEEIKVAKKLADEKQEKQELAKEQTQNYTSAIQRAYALFDLIEEGKPISAEDYEFLKEYSKTEEYKEHKNMGVFPDLDEMEIKIA
ncbi:Putative transcription regulator [Persephonella hydrogeniphila]|uniref:Putative transcription regulator n=1 Tax=Persephonella hydrogeniphila TaxID=198703 RepID=A0A285NE39_9AQUI|nr:Mu transposase C-terminal domain-containing protein [Persephonella hydrogeniphila]SNZ07719.1 Putative transcription regulator [Persephonella hydrogeniphila]